MFQDTLSEKERETDAEEVANSFNFPSRKKELSCILHFFLDEADNDDVPDILTGELSPYHKKQKDELKEIISSHSDKLEELDKQAEKLKNVNMTEYRKHLQSKNGLNYDVEVVDEAKSEYSILAILYLINESKVEISFKEFCSLNWIGISTDSHRLKFKSSASLIEIKNRFVSFMQEKNKDESSDVISIEEFSSKNSSVFFLQKETSPKYISQFKFRKEGKGRSKAPSEPETFKTKVRELKTNYITVENSEEYKIVKIAKNVDRSGWRRTVSEILEEVFDVDEPLSGSNSISSDLSSEITNEISIEDTEEKSDLEIIEDVKESLNNSTDVFEDKSNKEKIESIELIGVKIRPSKSSPVASFQIKSSGEFNEVVENHSDTISSCAAEASPEDIQVFARIRSEESGWDEFTISNSSWSEGVSGVSEKNNKILNQVFYNNE